MKPHFNYRWIINKKKVFLIQTIFLSLFFNALKIYNFHRQDKIIPTLLFAKDVDVDCTVCRGREWVLGVGGWNESINDPTYRNGPKSLRRPSPYVFGWVVCPSPPITHPRTSPPSRPTPVPLRICMGLSKVD